MAKRLFVGGLPYTATDEELKQLFSEIGEVTSVTVIKDPATGQGKGFGFVEYADDANAPKAIKELTGKELGGRKIIVNEARPREERTSGGYDNRGRDNNRGGASRSSKRW